MPLWASDGAAVCWASGTRDRVLVVLHEEDDRRLEDGGEVQRLVEVALAGARRRRSIASATVSSPLSLRGVRDADGVQQLGGQRGALRRDAVRVRVVAAVPVAAQQRQHLDRVDAAGDQRPRCRGRSGTASRRRASASAAADLAGLLAVRGRVDGEPALLGQRGGLGVEAAADAPSAGTARSSASTRRLRVVGAGRQRRAVGVEQADRLGVAAADGRAGSGGVAGRRVRGDALRTAWGWSSRRDLLDVWWTYASACRMIDSRSGAERGTIGTRGARQ